MRARHGAAFTLLELMAVVLMFALLASFVVPNLGILGSRTLRQQAERIAAQLELARARTVATAVPHRLVIDLEAGTYRLEWQGEPEAEGGELSLAEIDPEAFATEETFSLSAPQHDARDFTPLPGRFGRNVRLEDSLTFARVETPGGWVDSGEAHVAFESDGTAEFTTIVLDDDSGLSLRLEILPLADAVRIRHEET